MLRERYPIDPIPFAGGSILLCEGGRCIVQLDRLDEHAPDSARAHVNRFLSLLADLGHTGFVGDQSQFAIVREATRDED